MLAVVLFLMGTTAVVRSQNISEIAKSDPLIITGAIGTQNTYRYTSGGGYGSPMSNSIYANMNVSVYGFSMPFSLYYTNDNLSFSYPQISFNLTPQYKNWTGHFGLSSMSYSPYVMNMSFNGVGVEYNSRKLRFGAFYGRMKKAVNDNPLDPAARTPQYKRMAWGFKVGYGTSRNYLDLYFLRAYDAVNSLDEGWRNTIRPQENLVVGLKGCVTPVSWLSVTTNVAASAFNTDSESSKIENEKAKDFDKIFDVKYSSLMRFAGDVNVNLMLKGLSASLSYRLIQPDYTSLGTYYMANNYHSLGITASTSLFRRIALSATFSGQEDNLTNKQMFTSRGFVYNASASTHLGQHFNLSASYNGYWQTQGDGTAHVNDTIRLNRRMSSISLTPSYNTEGEIFGHSVSLSTSVTSNKDLNRFHDGKTDVRSIATGASYGLNVKPWETFFTASLSRQSSRNQKTRYSSTLGSINASRSFFEDKNLNLSATATMCYNEIKNQAKSLSMGADFSASYTFRKVHLVSAGASFNKFGDVNITKKRSGLDQTDITCSLNYTYTFSLLNIKSKSRDKESKK